MIQCGYDRFCKLLIDLNTLWAFPQVIQSQHLTESEVIFLELATLMTVLSFYRKLSCDGQPPMQGAFGSEQFCQHYAWSTQPSSFPKCGSPLPCHQGQLMLKRPGQFRSLLEEAWEVLLQLAAARTHWVFNQWLFPFPLETWDMTSWTWTRSSKINEQTNPHSLLVKIIVYELTRCWTRLLCWTYNYYLRFCLVYWV